MSAPERKLLLCSGGFDSISLLVLEKAQGADLTALFFDYSQMNLDDERAAARRFCRQFDIELIEAALPDAFPVSGLSRDDETAMGTQIEMQRDPRRQCCRR
jgi:7-cyano-7-deazaguanine synthase in queuosine biosynthesis